METIFALLLLALFYLVIGALALKMTLVLMQELVKSKIDYFIVCGIVFMFNFSAIRHIFMNIIDWLF